MEVAPGGSQAEAPSSAGSRWPAPEGGGQSWLMSAVRQVRSGEGKGDPQVQVPRTPPPPLPAQCRPGGPGFSASTKAACQAPGRRHQALCSAEGLPHVRNTRPTLPLPTLTPAHAPPVGGGADASLLKALFVSRSVSGAAAPPRGDDTHSPLGDRAERWR